MILILLDMGNVFVHNGGVVDKNDSWMPNTDARILKYTQMGMA